MNNSTLIHRRGNHRGNKKNSTLDKKKIFFFLVKGHCLVRRISDMSSNTRKRYSFNVLVTNHNLPSRLIFRKG